MDIYLISMVRSSTPGRKAQEGELVTALESKGHEVYWPIRDGLEDQDDAFLINQRNLEAITEADYVIVTSMTEGSIFDIGISVALNKRIVVAEWLLPPVFEKRSYRMYLEQIKLCSVDKEGNFIPHPFIYD
jgi:hypothetical protein